ncbi:MAG: L,D-transpeptidase family protein, partial [Pseudomonadota bacterium]|nr:L,D-transpeptidase family protein [Pseudomonadota bacterium]
ESIRAEHAAKGDPLPKVVAAGPDNPLGQYALRLGFPGYLIHGTNKPYGIGMRVSHGCVRMYPEDIATLFSDVPVGEPVNIVHQPYKFGWFAGELYLEAHPPFANEFAAMPSAQRLVGAVDAVNRKIGPWRQVDVQDAMRIARNPTGIPEPVRVFIRQ